MITTEQFKEIGLDVDELMGNAAIEWLADNTIIDTTDITKLSASARLFITKYAEINGKQSGVASESIEGLSQSFATTNKEGMIWDEAISILGASKLKSNVKFYSAKSKWR